MSLTKVSYSMINGAPANILDYGDVGDTQRADYFDAGHVGRIHGADFATDELQRNLSYQGHCQP